MRLTLPLFLAAAVALPVPTMAFENFIPLGNNYSLEDQELPPLNSRQDLINGQTDIFETEIYRRQRSAKVFQSEVEQFSNWQELNRSGSEYIDY